MITALLISKEGRFIEVNGHLFRRIEEFQEFPPVTLGGNELVGLCEAKENAPKPEGYLRPARGKDALGVRQLVSSDSDCGPKSVQAAETATDIEPLVCRWKLAVELSDWHVHEGERLLGSILGGNKEKRKTFMSLSRQEIYNGGMFASECFDSQQHLKIDAPTAGLDDGRRDSTKQVRSTGRELHTSKRRGREVARCLSLGPNTNVYRISKSRSQSSASVKGRHSSAVRGRPSDREGEVTRMVRSPSLTGLIAPEQTSEEEVCTFADAFCGAGGMSLGGLCISWAFDHDQCVREIYTTNQGRDVIAQMAAEECKLQASESAGGHFKVDTLHLWPPCNAFPRAHNGFPRAAVKANECKTYVGAIVGTVQPRMVTFEEAREILFRCRDYFTTMVHKLTSIGHNVRWKMIECVDFGLPRERKRLFTISSW